MEENMTNEVYEVDETVEAAPKKGLSPLAIGAIGVLAGAIAHKFIIAPWSKKRKEKKEAAKLEAAATYEADCSEVENSDN